jgi:3-hydroxybutyrate dehydrogenase
MTSDLDGRTAMITGGGGGIGRACVRALAGAGAKVHVVDWDDAAAHDAAAEVGGWAHVIDLGDARAIETLPSEIDILVNNAGLQYVAPLHEFPEEKFNLLQRVMVTAPFLLIKRCLPHMYEGNWGRIVNISSAHGLRASAHKVAYVAAKHGLEGLSKVAALEGAAHGVTSNCVNPGFVRTPLVENQIADLARLRGIDAERVVEQVMLDRSAIKRLIEPEQVAALVLWLCGEHASALTGAALSMDGGWTAN